MTDLRYAQFRGASGAGAHFEGADLRWTVFTRSKVRATSFPGVHFNGSDLRGAVFDRADLKNVTYSPETVWPAGFYTPPDRTVLE